MKTHIVKKVREPYLSISEYEVLTITGMTNS